MAFFFMSSQSTHPIEGAGLAQNTSATLPISRLPEQIDSARLVMEEISDEESVVRLCRLGHLVAFDTPGEVDDGHQLAPLRTIASQLVAMGCRVAVVQYPSDDKDYLSEFRAFYSGTFFEYPRYTVRLHFFQLKKEENEDVLTFIDRAYAYGQNPENLGQTTGYLGFMNVRPVRSSPVGRTVLGRVHTNVI